MFTLRRIIRNRKTLTNHVCTSKVLRSDESKKSDDVSGEPKKNEKEDSSSEKETSPHSSRVSAFFSHIKKEVRPKERPVRVSSDNKKDTEVPKFSYKSSKTKAKAPPKVEFKTDFFKKTLEHSAEKVAENLGGDKNKTKRDLLDYIKTFEVSKEEPKEDTAIPEINFKGSDSLGTELLMLISKYRATGIFTDKLSELEKDQVKLNTWNSLEEEHMEYTARKHPNNYFEELMQWTNEGRLWHFPIDNDQGREKEAEVSFTEHVFLERYLEPWCPKRGPLRRFMELVLTGLGKNPHLSVEEKKEHIEWFEKYFENKKKLLQELGAVGSTKQLEDTDPGEKSSNPS